jgi:hypothetical protein
MVGVCNLEAPLQRRRPEVTDVGRVFAPALWRLWCECDPRLRRGGVVAASAMTGQGTTIRLPGRLAIERSRVPSATVFPGRRPELVFAYLAAEHHRDVSRDELADALWPQELPDAWAAALRGVVSDVRRVIAAGELGSGELVERIGGGYRLRLPADVVLDLDEVRARLADARERVGGDPAGAAAAAAGAAELARLPFLPRHEAMGRPCAR